MPRCWRSSGSAPWSMGRESRVPFYLNTGRDVLEKPAGRGPHRPAARLRGDRGHRHLHLYHADHGVGDRSGDDQLGEMGLLRPGQHRGRGGSGKPRGLCPLGGGSGTVVIGTYVVSERLSGPGFRDRRGRSRFSTSRSRSGEGSTPKPASSSTATTRSWARVSPGTSCACPTAGGPALRRPCSPRRCDWGPGRPASCSGSRIRSWSSVRSWPSASISPHVRSLSGRYPKK